MVFVRGDRREKNSQRKEAAAVGLVAVAVVVGGINHVSPHPKHVRFFFPRGTSEPDHVGAHIARAVERDRVRERRRVGDSDRRSDGPVRLLEMDPHLCPVLLVVIISSPPPSSCMETAEEEQVDLSIKVVIARDDALDHPQVRLEALYRLAVELELSAVPEVHGEGSLIGREANEVDVLVAVPVEPGGDRPARGWGEVEIAGVDELVLREAALACEGSGQQPGGRVGGLASDDGDGGEESDEEERERAGRRRHCSRPEGNLSLSESLVARDEGVE